MTTVQWLIVGAGDIATRRAGSALVAAANSRLVAVCDVDRTRAEALAAQLGVDGVYADYGKALAESNADAVYIATPQNTHVELSLEALGAGKHLLCEKPIGVNGDEGLRLLDAVRRTDRTTSCSNYRRLSEQYKLTEGVLARGEIGELLGGWTVYSTPFYNPGNHPIRKALGMSRIKELGFYLIDIAHNLFGMPASAMASAATINKDVMNDVDDIAAVILSFPGGQQFTILFNCGSPGTRHELELFGTEGRIYWPDWPPHGNGPVHKVTRTGTETLDAHTDDNYHLPMIEDFVQALLQGRQPVCTVESAVKTEVITDAIFRSIDSGRAEPVRWEERS